MAQQEKRAWFILIVILVTLAAYVVFISVVRFDEVSLAVFGLSGFLGFWRSKRIRGEVAFDERDRQIEKQALLSSLCAFYVLILALSVAAGFTHWRDTSVPLWMVFQIFWAVSLVMWAIKALLIIVLYRRGAHA